MKYIFEYDEIKKCLECPFATLYIHDDKISCKLNRTWHKGDIKPSDCPLEVKNDN